MTLAATQRRPYDQRDLPEYGERGAAPSAGDCPTPRCRWAPPINYRNGTELDSVNGGNPQ